MAHVLIDPSLRRARLARFTVAALLVVTTLLVALLLRSLLRKPAQAASLPSPRTARHASGRRPPHGRRPRAGRKAPLLRRPLPHLSRDTVAPLYVTAFVEPSARGSLGSLAAHIDQINVVAPTGLRLHGGLIVDALDERPLALARAHGVPVWPLVQNLDDSGNWDGTTLVAAARQPAQRAHIVAALRRLGATHHLDGLHLDFEEIDDDWPRVVPLIADLARALHADGKGVAVDVAAATDERVLAQLAPLVDEVVVMAYDEHDSEDVPGPIASAPWVRDVLLHAASATGGKLTAGLGVYGYDWVAGAPGDPIDFVDAFTAAGEAHAHPEWDAALAATTFRFADEEGVHDVWLADAAALAAQLRTVDDAGVTRVALWRLGGEDPGVWPVLARRPPADWSVVPADARVTNEGDGPFLSLATDVRDGRRTISEGEHGIEERWTTVPTPYSVRRAGIVPGKVALTFDDGPDPRFTPAILRELAAAHAPATFFVIGLNAAQNPELVQQTLRAGHTLGNHSFTHPDVDEVSDLRLELELGATSRLLEGLTQRRPLLYRPPSLADAEPRTPASARAFARAGSLGYLVVDADVDPRDWAHPSADQIVERVLAQAQTGGVILLHDGGGDRTATVQALPRIIAQLRDRGLDIVPLSTLVGKSSDDIMPSVTPVTTAARVAEGAVLRSTAAGLNWGAAALTFLLVCAIIRAAALLYAAHRSTAVRRRRPYGKPQPVSVVVPAYNEGVIIARTVASILQSDLPVEVIVVDDGSTDDTAAVVRTHFGHDPRVVLVQQDNGGKASALRRGFARASHDLVVALDGDTIFRRDTVRRLVAPLGDPRVGAVAGAAEIGNVENVWCRLQADEYLVQQEIERRAWDALSAVPVVPGAVGAWRKQAVAAAGGFSSETLAEDADMAMALARAGWWVVYEPRARAATEAPAGWRTLARQRRRWCFGLLQALWKHRGAVGQRQARGFGRVVWPALVLSQVVQPLLMPVVLMATAWSLYAGRWSSALLATAILFAVEVAQLVTARRYAAQAGGRLDQRRGWLWLPARLVYRPLLFVILLRALWRTLDGIPLGWGKLARRGTSADAAATR